MILTQHHFPLHGEFRKGVQFWLIGWQAAFRPALQSGAGERHPVFTLRQPGLICFSAMPAFPLPPGGELGGANSVAGEVALMQTVQLGMDEGDKTLPVRLGEMLVRPSRDQ